MISQMYVLKIMLLTFLIGLSACAVKTEQVKKPYLQESAEQFMQAGIENYNRYHYAAALNQFANAREIYARYDDSIGVANAELNLCRVQMAVGQYDEVLQRLDELSVILERNQLRQQLIYRDIILSSVYLLKNDFDSAMQMLQVYDERLMNNSIDDKSLMAGLLINRVRLADAVNKNFDSWLIRFEEFVATNNSSDYKLRLYRFKASQMQDTGNTLESNRYYSQALDAYRQMADPAGVMSTLLEWAHAYAERHEWLPAQEKYQRALETGLINRNQRIVEQSLYGLSRIYIETAQHEDEALINNWLDLLKNEQGIDELYKQSKVHLSK